MEQDLVDRALNDDDVGRLIGWLRDHRPNATVEAVVLRQQEGIVAWGVTLPSAGLVGAATSFIAVRGGTVGVILVIGLLAVGALLIIRQANHNKVDFANVNDADQVVVSRNGGAAAVREAA